MNILIKKIKSDFLVKEESLFFNEEKLITNLIEHSRKKYKLKNLYFFDFILRKKSLIKFKNKSKIFIKRKKTKCFKKITTIFKFQGIILKKKIKKIHTNNINFRLYLLKKNFFKLNNSNIFHKNFFKFKRHAKLQEKHRIFINKLKKVFFKTKWLIIFNKNNINIKTKPMLISTIFKIK